MALSSIKRGGDKVSRPADAEERIAFRAELPGRDPKHPLWQFSVEVVEKAEGEGERLLMRVGGPRQIGLAMQGCAGTT